MGQEQPIQQPHSARNYHFQTNAEVKNQFKSNQYKQHEGILRLRPTPFPNCVEISNDGMLLFLQNAQATLQQLLENRLYTNRLFPLEDVEKLIESIVYTLAYLSESNIIYRDLCPQNIYYCEGAFKLLPNQLIDEYFYDKAWQNFYGLQKGNQENQSFSYLSPQLIIALRMREKNVQDFDILSKSNVFILGLILLEATTLLPSYECFDSSNYDIFNNIISERLDLVEDHYNDCIARIIANMLDYDFNERMNTKQLSIWINRELVSHRKEVKKSYETEQKKNLQPNKSTVVLHKSRLVIAQQAEKAHHQQINSSPIIQEQLPIPARSYSRKNVVYINGYDDHNKEDLKVGESSKGAKNGIYLEAVPYYEVDYQLDKKIDERHHLQAPDTRGKAYHRNIYPDTRNYGKNSNKFNYQIEQKSCKYTNPTEINYSDGNKLNRDYANQIENVNYVPYNAPPQSTFLREVANMRSKIIENDTNYQKTYDNTQHLRDQTVSNSKLRNQNRFYPNLSQLENVQRHTEQTKRIAKHSQVGMNSRAKQCFDSKQSKQSDSKCSMNDGSINRIKLEIQKSRKLIEQFRKTEGLAE